MTPDLKNILVVDDEAGMRHMLQIVLEKGGYRVTEAATAAAALALFADHSFDLVLCDIRMPEMDGLGFLKEVSRLGVAATIIMMSAYGSIDTAIECMKCGAYDYISKPFRPDEVLLTLKKAEERLNLRQENSRLREELARDITVSDASGMVYCSAEMGKVMALVEQVADSASSVLITGETGTGKELVARALHAGGERRDAPFVAVNCSAITSGLMESELFGHVRGAFTGAVREKEGLFAAAGGGTLFLDEIGELPLELQPKLLRVLQEGEVMRVGETRPRRIDVRVLAATARDLKAEVAKGRFRDDLYYRLAVVEIHIPSLRERAEDIPLLARHFVRRIASRMGCAAVPVINEEALEALKTYSWPGNVRELENFMEKTMIFNRGEIINSAALPWDAPRSSNESLDYSLKQAVFRLEREFIRKALAATGGNRTQAAKLLEISLRGLLYKMKEHGIE